MRQAIYNVPAAHSITITAEGATAYAECDQDPTQRGIVAANASVTYGPYGIDRTFTVTGIAFAVVSEADPAPGAVAASAIVLAIPDEDQEDEETVWNDAGVLKVSGAGA